MNDFAGIVRTREPRVAGGPLVETIIPVGRINDPRMERTGLAASSSEREVVSAESIEASA